MKAIVYHTYGPPDVLKMAEVPDPVPGEDEVLIKVHAAAINYPDVALTRGEPFMTRLWSGFPHPKNTIPGDDIAGRIEAVGANVTQFQPGDAVYGDLSRWGRGGFAEYVCTRAEALALKPANVSFAEAAAVPMAGVVALQGLRDKGRIQAGQSVLINGASGGIGTFAVQIAKAFGTEVTGVCSTRNVEMVRAIGADYVIDYTQEDFAQNNEQYDLILATAGYRSISDYRRALRPNGICVVSGGAMAQITQVMVLGPWVSLLGSRKIGNFLVKPNPDDLVVLKELIEAGKIKPVIDRCYPLQEVADAICYYESGHTRGKIVITIDN